MSHRTGQKVRRSSRPKGRCEAGFWRAFDPKQAKIYMIAVRRYNLLAKEKGKKNGKLGHVAIEVFAELLRRVDYATGQLDPAIDTLAKVLKRSRAAVIAALKTLQSHGFVQWLRRFEPVKDAGWWGPQVQQSTNAYRLSLPAMALKLVGIGDQAAPIPDDFDARKAAAAAEIRAMEFQDTPLGRTLERMERHFQDK